MYKSDCSSTEKRSSLGSGPPPNMTESQQAGRAALGRRALAVAGAVVFLLTARGDGLLCPLPDSNGEFVQRSL